MQQVDVENAENVNTGFGDTRRPAEADVSILDLLTVILQRKRFILGTTLVVGILAAVVSGFLPPSFTAEASILLPQQQQSSLSALASGALGGLAGSSMASQLGLKNPGDLYIGLLGSRTIADRLISRFDLKNVYNTKLPSATRKALGKHASFLSGKDSLIKISVSDGDPKRAADLANGFVDELHNQNSRLAISDASQRRLFFEEELGKQKDALADAEISLRNAQQSTGLVAPAAQAEALIHSGAQLRAEIASRQVQLEALRAYATDENPQVEVLKKEIGAMQGQMAQLEANGASNSKIEFSAGKLPEASLEYIRKFRDMKYHETLYELLAKQYEAARIDESKQAPLIQVVDRAVAPDKKAGPPRGLITLAAAFAALVISGGWVIVAGAIHSLAQKPDQAAQLHLLGKALRS
jgi:tyrosine-protein kinase Etk/Wzc